MNLQKESLVDFEIDIFLVLSHLIFQNQWVYHLSKIEISHILDNRRDYHIDWKTRTPLIRPICLLIDIKEKYQFH